MAVYGVNQGLGENFLYFGEQCVCVPRVAGLCAIHISDLTARLFLHAPRTHAGTF